MILYGLVISDEPDRYTSKRGTVVESQIVTIVDQDKSGHRLRQSVDVVLMDEAKQQFAGKLLDKRVELSISEISIFGGRPRFRGNIISLEGKSVNGQPAK